jgi:hypothetical protein
VVPILRLGDYTSIPGNLTRDLRNDNCPDFRAERGYEQALDELALIVREPVVPLGSSSLHREGNAGTRPTRYVLSARA